MMSFRSLGTLRLRVGESPVWDERRDALFACDILGQQVVLVNLDGAVRGTWSFDKTVGSLGLTESGRVVVALGRDVVLFDPESGAVAPLARLPEPDTNRLNDGKVGPDGCFYVGSMDDRADKQPIGALYKVSANGCVERVADGLLVPNGLAWSPDGSTIFHSDSRGPYIDRCAFDLQRGTLSKRRRFVTLNDKMGRPDGGACDALGHYWSAGVSAGILNRFSESGELVEKYRVPVNAPTMPCFCGPGLARLAVTSLTEGLTDAARVDSDGAILIADAPVTGVPVSRMRGI